MEEKFLAEAYGCVDCKVLVERVEVFERKVNEQLDENIWMDSDVLDIFDNVDNVQTENNIMLADARRNMKPLIPFNPFTKTKNLPFGPCQRLSIAP